MSMKVKNLFSLGCDPELFLADHTGRLKASCGLIGGTKTHPQPLTELGDGFAIQEDNVAVEFNIPPSTSKREFVSNVSRAMKFIGDGVNSGLNLTIVPLSAASFPEEELTSPAAKEFGCDPDFNAWTGEKNPRPKAVDQTLRSCGGHVHVGYDKRVSPSYLIRCMDLFLGVPSVLMDKGELRKQLYGKAGAFRDKSYGVEYRTLSNFWVFNPKLEEWVWDSTEKAYAAADSQFPVGEYKERILDAINNNNKDAAARLVDELKMEVVIV
jgi:hypothetical protein